MINQRIRLRCEACPARNRTVQEVNMFHKRLLLCSECLSIAKKMIEAEPYKLRTVKVA